MIGTLAPSKKILTITAGDDRRPRSEAFAYYLIFGLSAADFDVIDTGLFATPILHFSIRHLKAGGGAVVKSIR